MNDLEEKYIRWLDEFGQWLAYSGRITSCAEALGISKQTCSRYFVKQTHSCPVEVFFKALIWTEKYRSFGYSRYSPPSAEFQNWNVLQVPVPSTKSSSGTPVQEQKSRNGTRPRGGVPKMAPSQV